MYFWQNRQNRFLRDGLARGATAAITSGGNSLQCGQCPTSLREIKKYKKSISEKNKSDTGRTVANVRTYFFRRSQFWILNFADKTHFGEIFCAAIYSAHPAGQTDLFVQFETD